MGTHKRTWRGWGELQAEKPQKKAQTPEEAAFLRCGVHDALLYPPNQLEVSSLLLKLH